MVLDTVFGKLGKVKLCWFTEVVQENILVWHLNLVSSELSGFSARKPETNIFKHYLKKEAELLGTGPF